MPRSTALALAAVLTIAGATRAQEPADTIVPQTRKGTVTAGVLEWLVPTLGYAYAEDWSRGLLPNSVRVVGAIGYLTKTNEAGGDCDQCTLWYLTYLAGWTWSIVGAVRAVDDYNARQEPVVIPRAALRPSPFGGMELAIRVR